MNLFALIVLEYWRVKSKAYIISNILSDKAGIQSAENVKLVAIYAVSTV